VGRAKTSGTVLHWQKGWGGLPQEKQGSKNEPRNWLKKVLCSKSAELAKKNEGRMISKAVIEESLDKHPCKLPPEKGKQEKKAGGPASYTKKSTVQNSNAI